jgi:peptidoglycan-associated lipoprotein
MIKYKLISLLIAGLLLGGCAELSELAGGPDAPVEERGAVATTGAGSGGGAAGTATTSGAAGQGVDGVGTAGVGAGQQVETHALPTQGAGDAQSVGGSGMTAQGGPAIVGVSPETAAMLRDPDNVLSKRVILFDFDSDAIREEYRALVEAHAGFLKENPAAGIILQGHTDERGSRDYNLALGQRRAESVRQALSLMGVRVEQVETVSLGEEKPVQEGQDEEAWRQNRRAEIHYLGE